MRLYLTHRPDSGATEVRVEVSDSLEDGLRLFAMYGLPKGEHVIVRPGTEPPLYCPPIPDAEMARLLGIEP